MERKEQLEWVNCSFQRDALILMFPEDKHSESARRHMPDAAATNCLLGKLWRAQGDDRKAVQSYVEALKLHPFMWDAFLDLCHMGVKIWSNCLDESLTSCRSLDPPF